jgi:hypothetical protein
MGRVSLPEGAKPKIDVMQPEIMVLHDNILHVFDISTGKWSQGVAIKLREK